MASKRLGYVAVFKKTEQFPVPKETEEFPVPGYFQCPKKKKREIVTKHTGCDGFSSFDPNQHGFGSRDLQWHHRCDSVPPNTEEIQSHREICCSFLPQEAAEFQRNFWLCLKRGYPQFQSSIIMFPIKIVIIGGFLK